MKLRTMILVALFAALTAVGAFIKIPMVPVAITLQTLFSLAAGALLGPAAGAASQGIYLLLGLVGLPIFTAGGGFDYILKPSFGFLLALPVAACVAGLMTRGKAGVTAGAKALFVRVLTACAAAALVVYVIGVPYMYFILNFYIESPMDFPTALWSGMALFLPGDALKCVAIAAFAPRVWRYVRR